MDNTVQGTLVTAKPLGKLASALAKAQRVIVTPKKTREVDYTDKQGRRIKYKYADLNDCIDALKEPLATNALSYTQTMGRDPDLGFGLFTTLMHESGEFETSFYPLPDPDKLRPQEFGSAITYARRYSLSSITGIASEEDDDGKAGSEPEPQAKQNSKAPPAQNQTKGKAPMKNHAPQGKAPPPPPADPFPPDDAERQAAIQELYSITEELGITPHKAKEYVEMALGRSVKSTNLTLVEARKVISFLKDMPQ